MAAPSSRFFIQLDPYEAQLLSRLHRDLTARAKAAGKKRPSKKTLISGCIRTAIHTVYGEEFAHEELLGSERFRELMAEVDMGPDELDDAP